MNKVKAWLCDRFLPAWCQEKTETENRRLAAKVSALKQENETLRAYIDGLHDALKYSRKINIYTGGEQNGDTVASVRTEKNPKP